MSDGIAHDLLLIGLHSSLNTLAESQGGKALIAGDALVASEMLLSGPGTWRCVIWWAGDSQLGDLDQSPLVTMNISMYVGYAPGLGVQLDKALVTDSGNRPSLMKLVNLIRKRILALEFPEEVTSVNPRYVGTNQLSTPDGVPLSAYQLNFELDYVPEVDESEEVEINPG